MIEPAPIIIVGDATDPHVREVASLLPPSALVIVDATRLNAVLLSMDLDHTVLRDVTGKVVNVGAGSPARGWLRRLAPAAWGHGVSIGSHAAAVLSSRMTLLAALLRDRGISWITAVDDLFPAENKVVQYRAAVAVGIRVPKTLVSAQAAHLADDLAEPFVVKPLGPGNFDEDGRQHVAYARRVRAADLAEVDLLAAPFLSQQAVEARRHLRVVTVGQRAWVAELDGADLPLDWREHPPAHHAFRVSRDWAAVERAAVTLAGSLRVGLSSQDWIVDNEGPAFLDLNPGGQWLFLPPEITGPVTTTLTDRLAGR